MFVEINFYDNDIDENPLAMSGTDITSSEELVKFVSAVYIAAVHEMKNRR